MAINGNVNQHRTSVEFNNTKDVRDSALSMSAVVDWATGASGRCCLQVKERTSPFTSPYASCS